MGSSSQSQTVGYKYSMGVHKVLCSGPIDKLMKITIDDKVAWEGDVNKNAEIYIDKPDLFGGTGIEGGCQGYIDVMLGGVGQGANSYLKSVLPNKNMPSYRGVVSIILKNIYYGMNPQIKSFAYKVSRIHTKEKNFAQWYDEKSEINYYDSIADDPAVGLSEGSRWHYRVASGWVNGLFGKYYPMVGGYYDLSGITSTDGLAECYVPFSTTGFDPYTPTVEATVVNGHHQPFLILDLVNGTSEQYQSISGPTRYGFRGIDTDTVGMGETIPVGKPTASPGQPEPVPAFTDAVLVKEFYFYGDLDKGFELDMYSTVTARVWLNQRADGISGGAQLLVAGVTKVILKRVPSNPNAPELGYYGLKHGKNLIAIEFSNNLHGFGCYGSGTPFYFTCKSTIDTSKKTQPDMNPAHIIRECLTESWGLGLPSNSIDDDSFRKAADVLYKEGLGISLTLDSQVEVRDFINKIRKHIDASLYVDRSNGKFVLKLIRNDYKVSDLMVLDKKNVSGVSDFSKTQQSELVNSVTVTYTNTAINKPSTVTVQDIALQNSANGNIISLAVNYEGFTNPDVASRIAQRDLQAASTSVISCTVDASSVASSLNIGDCFILNWPEFNVNNRVMRVIGINYGDGTNYSVKIKCVQDVFSTPSKAIISTEKPDWNSPITEPAPAEIRTVFEMPYYSLVRKFGEDSVSKRLESNHNASFIGCAAARPSSDSINANMYVAYSSDSDQASDYKNAGTFNFCPVAELAVDVDQMDTVFEIKNGINLSLITSGGFFQIGSEYGRGSGFLCEMVGFETISSGDTSIKVKRGCLDTLPKIHKAGTKLFFWQDFHGFDTTEYYGITTGYGENTHYTAVLPGVAVRICPTTLKGELPLRESNSDLAYFYSRAYNRYPPADIKINGQYFPKYIKPEIMTVTWVHRNRIQQTSGLIGFTDGNITPEENTGYQVVFDTPHYENIFYDGTNSVYVQQPNEWHWGWNRPYGTFEFSKSGPYAGKVIDVFRPDPVIRGTSITGIPEGVTMSVGFANRETVYLRSGLAFDLPQEMCDENGCHNGTYSNPHEALYYSSETFAHEVIRVGYGYSYGIYYGGL